MPESKGSSPQDRPTVAEIMQASDEASAGTHKHRAMRVTLECAHLRLMPWINCIQGIGAQTACNICPDEEPGYKPSRLVVNVEETGVLHDSWAAWFREYVAIQKRTYRTVQGPNNSEENEPDKDA